MRVSNVDQNRTLESSGMEQQAAARPAQPPEMSDARMTGLEPILRRWSSKAASEEVTATQVDDSSGLLKRTSLLLAAS